MEAVFGILWGYLGGVPDEGCPGVPRGIFEGGAGGVAALNCTTVFF